MRILFFIAASVVAVASKRLRNNACGDYGIFRCLFNGLRCELFNGKCVPADTVPRARGCECPYGTVTAMECYGYFSSCCYFTPMGTGEFGTCNPILGCCISAAK